MREIRKLPQGQLAGFFSFLILWELLHLILQTHAIPSPVETVSYLLTVPDILLKHCTASILRVTAAMAISLILGVPAGILLGVNRTCKSVFSPLLYFIYPIPKVAFLPVFMLLFGLGDASKIILIIFIILFQIMLSVRDGVDRIPRLYFKVMESFCVTGWQRYRYLVVPAILPQLFSALRISIGISLASLFFAENYATEYGIGYYIMSAWTKMNYVEMFAGILALGLTGIVLYQILDRLERACAPWLKYRNENGHS